MAGASGELRLDFLFSRCRTSRLQEAISVFPKSRSADCTVLDERRLSPRHTMGQEDSPGMHLLDGVRARKSVHGHTLTVSELLHRNSIVGPRVEHMREPCLLWKAARDQRGRPRLWFKGSNNLATRVARMSDDLPGQALAVVQLCHTRDCVRPEHIVACDLRTAHRLRGRGLSPLGSGDL